MGHKRQGSVILGIIAEANVESGACTGTMLIFISLLDIVLVLSVTNNREYWKVGDL